MCAPLIDEQETRRVADIWFDGMKTQDFDASLKLLAPDVEWHNIPRLPIKGLSEIAPWFGTFLGKEAVLGSFATFANYSVMLKYELYDVFIKDDKALAVTHEHAKCLANGIEYDLDIANEIVVQGGQVVKWQVYWDPTPLVAAYQDQLDARFLDAARRGDILRIAALLNVGADINTVDPENEMSALMIAAGVGQPEVVRLLLAQGADVDDGDSIGATALHKACQSGNLDCVQQLLDAGSMIDQQTATTGHSPLIEAIWFTWPEVVACLLDRGAGLALRTHYGFSIDDHIDYALRVNLDAQPALLKIRALVEARRAQDQQLQASQTLMAAVVANDLVEVTRLIAAGADLVARAPVLNGFNDGHTPLHVAAREGRTKIVAALLHAGADPNLIEPVFGAVPLHKATYNGHEEITALLAHQPGINLDHAGPSNGYTPLLDAIWHGFDGCAKILVEAGARLDLRGHDGASSLELARRVLGAENPVTKLIASRMAAPTEGAQ